MKGTNTLQFLSYKKYNIIFLIIHQFIINLVSLPLLFCAFLQGKSIGSVLSRLNSLIFLGIREVWELI